MGMVMMVRFVAALPSGMSVEDLDENWAHQLPNRVECTLDGRCSPPATLDGRRQCRLDWGTIACELSDGDLELIAPAEDLKKVPPLRHGEKYVGLWVEAIDLENQYPCSNRLRRRYPPTRFPVCGGEHMTPTSLWRRVVQGLGQAP